MLIEINRVQADVFYYFCKKELINETLSEVKSNQGKDFPL